MGTEPSRSRDHRSINAGVRVLWIVGPVALATVLQIADKANAPLWLSLALISGTGIASAMAAWREAKRAGVPAPGALRIDAVHVEDLSDDSVALDFRVTNVGGSTVLINAVTFRAEAVDFHDNVTLGPLESSYDYDMDIGALTQAGQEHREPVSQQVHPGDVDRFRLALIATKAPPASLAEWPEPWEDAYRIYALVIVLETNFGSVATAPLTFEIATSGEPWMTVPADRDAARRLSDTYTASVRAWRNKDWHGVVDAYTAMQEVQPLSPTEMRRLNYARRKLEAQR